VNAVNHAELQQARWLVEHANDALATVESWETVDVDSLKLASHFRKTLDAEQSRSLCQLFEMRRRAVVKFSKAEQMFFSRVGYEQSTSEAIASYKSRRFQGTQSVVDLCCGIGGDATALAKVSRELTLVDLSVSVVEFAKANLRVYGEQAIGCAADIREFNLSRYDAWHLDPDRRVDGNRRSDPNACEPPLEEFLVLPGLPSSGAVKLSPAADAISLLDRGVELEWIGNHHECQQQVAWFGDLARHPGKRTATWLSGKPNQSLPEVSQLVEDDPNESLRDVASFEGTPNYVYEPRPSVLAAGLDVLLAKKFGLKRLAKSPYLASNAAEISELFRRFKVVQISPFHRKTLKRQLADSGLRVTEVKKRGVDIAPENVLRELRANQEQASGLRAVVAMVYAAGKSVQVVLAERDD
jgi:hypothetical protein